MSFLRSLFLLTCIAISCQRNPSRRTAQKTQITGMLTGDAKWGAFQGCEAFVLPSHQENFGLAAAEAMACGKPVLLSDKVGIAEEISEYGTGLMELDTPEGTLRLLRRWIDMSLADRQQMGALAHQYFHLRFDMSKNTKSILRLFETAAVSTATAMHPERPKTHA